MVEAPELIAELEPVGEIDDSYFDHLTGLILLVNEDGHDETWRRPTAARLRIRTIRPVRNGWLNRKHLPDEVWTDFQPSRQ